MTVATRMIPSLALFVPHKTDSVVSCSSYTIASEGPLAELWSHNLLHPHPLTHVLKGLSDQDLEGFSLMICFIL